MPEYKLSDALYKLTDDRHIGSDAPVTFDVPFSSFSREAVTQQAPERGTESKEHPGFFVFDHALLLQDDVWTVIVTYTNAHSIVEKDKKLKKD